MQVKTIGVRDFRGNFTKLAKNSRKNHTIFLVTHHKKPLYEVRPCFNESVEIDEVDLAHLHAVEKNLSFWNDDADDNIFKA